MVFMTPLLRLDLMVVVQLPSFVAIGQHEAYGDNLWVLHSSQDGPVSSRVIEGKFFPSGDADLRVTMMIIGLLEKVNNFLI